MIQEDLKNCSVVLGIKEVPCDSLLEDKAYFFFSHTMKGQAYNMKLLERIIEKRITLIDYELITDDRGKRTIVFGYYAGAAGAFLP